MKCWELSITKCGEENEDEDEARFLIFLIFIERQYLMTNVIDTGCDVSDVPGFLGAENLGKSGSSGQLGRVRTSWQTCFVC